MYYEINVSLNGRHFFATSERSIHDEFHCKVLYDKLRQAFPESEGYVLSVSKCQKIGESVNMQNITYPLMDTVSFLQNWK